MTEFERTRQRERAPLKEDPYEYTMRERAQLKERNQNGLIVIKQAKRKEFVTRQGRARWMLQPGYYPEAPLQMWRVFIHEIRTRSGKHRHQGGLIIYVLEGKGYSIIEGERKDWEKGDLLLLPIWSDS